MSYSDVKALADKYFYEQCLRLGPIDDKMPSAPIRITLVEDNNRSVYDAIQMGADIVRAPTVCTPAMVEIAPADEYYLTMHIDYDIPPAVDETGDCI